MKAAIYILNLLIFSISVGAYEYVPNIPEKLPLSPDKREKFGFNYDESKASKAQIPELLSMPDGRRISTAQEWERLARPRIKRIVLDELYGRIPPRPAAFSVELIESSDSALGGKALRRQYKLVSCNNGKEHSFIVLLYIPKGAEYPVPVFAGLNFCGNYAISPEKEIILPDGWVRNVSYQNMKISDNRANEKFRGAMSSRWNVEDLISRGYALATAYYCDIFPDDKKTRGGGIYEIFGSEFKDGGAISAWAWGLSRILDALETVSEIDSDKVVAIGHSRLGKTALLAAAADERFAAAVSNNSGCMGAAMSRRNYGENIAIITNFFPNWFSKNLNKYAKVEENLPIDQHHLLALIAPRGLCVASATEDLWADPKGELLSLVEASKVYALYGANLLPDMKNLRVEEPFMGDVSYHLRNGKHNITPYDWRQYMDYADKIFKGGKQ